MQKGGSSEKFRSNEKQKVVSSKQANSETAKPSVQRAPVTTVPPIRSALGTTPTVSDDLQIGRVYNWLLVSSDGVASNLAMLRSNNVRRIVNLATGCENKFPNEFRYLKIPINDVPTARLCDYFSTTFQFIDEGRLTDEVCLVHCNAGISRSCSIVIAYVMRYESMTFMEAFEKVTKARSVCSPNLGFREQLRQLEIQLRTTCPLTYPASKRSGHSERSDSTSQMKSK